ncbi:polyprenyl synthetase family protein [Bacillus pseudomycoides]|uniref:Polyprenyl synthetase family protein n=1 Tax=Bacillus bingmayongensis TaxID=1150157 RepID=A0ABU5JRH1_9BACI|nr:polyprenyl synthetase family protein [Bacillus pseudomycoides]
MKLDNIVDFCNESIRYSVDQSIVFKNITEIHYHAFKNESNNIDIDRVSKLVQKTIISFDIFDDVQDKDNYSAPWSSDERQAINLGLYLLIDACKEVHKCDFLNKQLAFEYMSMNLLNSIKGQYIDIQNNFNTKEEYIKMCQDKSGSLVSFAAIMGALTATTDYLLDIHSYSLDIGIAAQISNDIRDLIQFETKSDLMEKKITLPIIYLLAQVEKTSLIKDYFSDVLTYDEIQKDKTAFISLLYNSGALSYATKVKKEYLKRAMDKVNRLPINATKKSIIIDKLIKNI